MNNLQSLQLIQPGPVAGEFRLRDASINETREGRQYLRIYLEDMSGSIPGYVWREEIYRGLCLQNYSLVRIVGQSRFHDDLLQVDLYSIEPIGFKRAGEVVRLIPRASARFPVFC